MVCFEPVLMCPARTSPSPTSAGTLWAWLRAARRVLWPTVRDSRLHRFHHALMAMLTVLALLAGYGNAANEDTTVQAVKAAFMFNFAKFASWPQDTFATASSPVRLCIYKDSLSDEVTAPLSGKLLQDRPVKVIPVTDMRGVKECHVLYLAAHHADAALARGRSILDELPVLTISDAENFAQSLGHIGLFEENGRLRFQINLAAVEKSGLGLSSKLLNLAEIVDRRR